VQMIYKDIREQTRARQAGLRRGAGRRRRACPARAASRRFRRSSPSPRSQEARDVRRARPHADRAKSAR
jgi:hypothetical protein